jgi:DNA-directed RNA polymerase subunit M/transcription elongation factor TFIIS
MLKQIKQVCKCENCGNEAEMVLTCTLEEDTAAAPDAEPRASEQTHKHQMKGHGVCSHCGNEADMWVDIGS